MVQPSTQQVIEGGLKEPYEVGIVKDFEGWVKKLDEPAPNWLVFHLVNELRRRGKTRGIV